MSPRLKILSIDDDPSFNKIMQVFAKKRNYKLTTTTTPKAFLDRAKLFDYDAFIVDLNLGDLAGGGFLVVQAIRNKLSTEIPIIVISRRPDPKSIAHAMEIGANDYLTKPIDADLLESKLLIYENNNDGTAAPLKYFLTPQSKRDCTITVDYPIQSISEFGITLIGPDYIAKGTMLNITGNIIKEICNDRESLRLSVTTTSANEDQTFSIFLEFEALDQDLQQMARAWIINKT